MSPHSHGALVSAKPRRSECRFPASERPFDTRCIERRQLGELGDLAVGRDRGADSGVITSATEPRRSRELVVT